MLKIHFSSHLYVHIELLSVLSNHLVNAEEIKYTVRYFQTIVK